MTHRTLALFAIGFVLCALTGVGRVVAGDEGPSEQEAVSLLTEYLRIDTTNPPGNEIKAAEFFKAIFDREGIEAHVFESAPGRGNIYARLKGDGSKKAVVLLNHMDVVPADRRYWSVDPFSGLAKDGFLWGRGTLDMKGMGVVELMAILALKRQSVPLKADIIFLGTADEEAGGVMGAGFVAREHFELIKDAGLVSGLDPAPERRERLKNLKESLRDPAFAAEFTKDRWANAAVRNTISITMLEGSNKINVIPAEASAQLDVRLLPSQDPELFLGDLRKIIGDDSIKIETVLSFPPSASPTDSEFFKVLQEVADRFDPGAKVTTPLLSGFTDCHFFREKGIPCYGFIPFKVQAKDLGSIHGNDERISVENLKSGTREMYEIVRKIATQ